MTMTKLLHSLLLLLMSMAVGAERIPIESIRSLRSDQLTTRTSSSSSVVAPDLPLGDINLVVVTDVHSWVAGHRNKEPHDNVDYGGVVSFYERLQSYCTSTNKDLWFVMNGDWIDGTGLSLDGNTTALTRILYQMPFDILNTGNHELYKDPVVDTITKPQGFADFWGPRYLSSNILSAKTNEPLGNRYRLLRGKYSNVLVFGFLYNMEGASEKVRIELVQEAVKQDWFTSVLQGNNNNNKQKNSEDSFDAILVMAHMGTDDESVPVLQTAIRSIVGESFPVQFINGHTHQRRFSVVDEFSTAVEAGRYLDTVAFVSFPNATTVMNMNSNNAPNNERKNISSAFHHVFIDANEDLLKQKLKLETNTPLMTPTGQSIQNLIQETRHTLGLDLVIGCSPQHYVTSHALEKTDSLWGLFQKQVIPSVLDIDPTHHRAVLIFQGSWRYDLFAGKTQVDDVIAVSPFDDTFYSLGTFDGQTVLDLYDLLHHSDNSNNFLTALPDYILSGTVIPNEDTELFTDTFEMKTMVEGLKQLLPNQDIRPTISSHTTTSLWLNFVEKEWPCDRTSTGRSRSTWILFFCVVFGGGSLFSWFVVCKHWLGMGVPSSNASNRGVYQEAIAAEEDPPIVGELS